jgi:hypothetical protein
MYDLFPFHEHPLWRAVRGGNLSFEQVIKAEAQHWLRTRTGQSLRRAALDAVQQISPAIFQLLLVAAAFTNWFSLIRFFAGLLLALAAYGTMPQQPQFYAGTAAPATLPAPANAALQRQSDESPPSPQTSADPLLRPAIRGSARGL